MVKKRSPKNPRRSSSRKTAKKEKAPSAPASLIGQNESAPASAPKRPEIEPGPVNEVQDGSARSLESPSPAVASSPPLEETNEENQEIDTKEVKEPDGETVSSETDEEMELLTFSLSGEEYAMNIMTIQEITKLTEVTPIPRVPSYVKGIITLRGNVIPVFDMSLRLDLASFQKGSESRFIICSTKEGMAAMRVDEVTGVIRLKKSRLEAPPSVIASRRADLITNIGRYRDRLLILLDVEKALQIDR